MARPVPPVPPKFQTTYIQQRTFGKFYGEDTTSQFYTFCTDLDRSLHQEAARMDIPIARASILVEGDRVHVRVFLQAPFDVACLVAHGTMSKHPVRRMCAKILRLYKAFTLGK